MKILASVQREDKLQNEIEEFYYTIPLQDVTGYIEKLLQINKLDITYNLVNNRIVLLNSPNLVNESPILSAIFKECKLIDFGGGIYLKNKQEYNDGARPEFTATINIDLQYKSNDNGTNSISLFRAQYSQSKGEWEFYRDFD